MTLVATGSSAPPADAPAITNNGFWPDIVPGAMRAAHRIDGTVTPDKLSTAIGAAMREVNRILRTFQAEQVAAGVEKSADIPLDHWQIPLHHSTLYIHGVYDYAHALLMERYTDVTATGDRDQSAAEQKAADAATYRQAGSHALSELTGRNHATVELI